jgi:diguanylate cyclase
VAEKVRTSVMGRELVKRSTGESLGRITISVGVAIYRRGRRAARLGPNSGDVVHRIGRDAVVDDAIAARALGDCMFTAKRSGRNRVVDDGVPADTMHDVA